MLCAARADHRERRPRSSLVSREDQGIEEVGDEVGKVIGMVVGKENMRNSMPVHSGLHEVSQGARAKIQQYRMVSLDQIAGCRAGRMDVGTGTENRETHRPSRLKLRLREIPGRETVWYLNLDLNLTLSVESYPVFEAAEPAPFRRPAAKVPVRRTRNNFV